MILHNTINTNGVYNVSHTDNTFNTTDNQYCTKEINNTSNVANDITRHNHKNCDHNIIKKGTWTYKPY